MDHASIHPAMRCFSFLLLCLFFQIGTARAQQNIVDSLYAELKNHPTRDSARLDIMFDLCYRESYVHPEKTKELAEEALSISSDLGYLRGIARSNRFLATYYNNTGEKEKAITHAYAMLAAFEKVGTGAEQGLGQANQLLGIIHEELRNYQKAKKFYVGALSIFEKAGLRRDIGYCYNSLASLHTSLEQYDSALHYNLKAMKEREAIQDEKGLALTYANIADTYMNLGNYTLAESFFEKALPITKKLNNQYYLAYAYLNMGKLYTILGQLDKASGYLQQALPLAQAMKEKRLIEDVYKKLGELEKKRGHFAQALEYFELKMAYRDSVFNEERSKQIAELETRFETEKKNRAIDLLERDNRIQRMWTYLWLIGFVVIASISAVYYFFQRYREDKNRRILNLQIDQLIAQRNEMADKYKMAISEHVDAPMASRDQQLIKKMLDAIEANLDNPHFGVDQMADSLGMSRASLHRKMKAITGLPPSEFIRNIRLRKAAAMLASQADSVKQVGLAVGFEDQSYFAKSFKKQFGVSPSEYHQVSKLVETLEE